MSLLDRMDSTIRRNPSQNSAGAGAPTPSPLVGYKGGVPGVNNPKGENKYLQDVGVQGSMEDYLKRLMLKSQQVLSLKAPNYKGKRVAGPTGQLDRARQAMNTAGQKIMNPNPAFGAAVGQFLTPGQFAGNPNVMQRAQSFLQPPALPSATPNLPQPQPGLPGGFAGMGQGGLGPSPFAPSQGGVSQQPGGLPPPPNFPR